MQINTFHWMTIETETSITTGELIITEMPLQLEIRLSELSYFSVIGLTSDDTEIHRLRDDSFKDELGISSAIPIGIPKDIKSLNVTCIKAHDRTLIAFHLQSALPKQLYLNFLSNNKGNVMYFDLPVMH